MKKSMFLFVFVMAVFTLTAQENLISNAGFTKRTDKGRLASWSIYGVGEWTVEKDGIEGNILKITLVQKLKATGGECRGTIYQKLPELKPGKYELSVRYRGKIRAFWVSLAAKKDGKSKGLGSGWVEKQKFKPDAKYPGWFKFYKILTVPQGMKEFMIEVAGFGPENTPLELTGVELYSEGE